MKKLQVILIALTALAGCTNRKGTAATTAQTMNAKDTLTYLALGDSYTIGESVSLDESFPHQLTKALVADSLHVTKPTIIARTGWTTNDLSEAIAASGIQGKTYDFVTLLIGVNDQYQNLSQNNYRGDFKKTLTTAISFAKGDTSRVFVLSIPDWGVTPYSNGEDKKIGPLIDQFNAINKAESKKAGVHYLDITAISRQAKTDRTLIAIDSLHPSPKMYGLWIDKLKPMVLKAKLGK